MVEVIGIFSVILFGLLTISYGASIRGKTCWWKEREQFWKDMNKERGEVKMKYKGIELQEITQPQIFDPPKQMLVWDSDSQEPRIELVWCIAPASAKFNYPIRCIGNDHYDHYEFCAEIPEESKPKRATNLQFTEWLAKGNGIWKRKKESYTFTNAPIPEDMLGKEVEKYVLIRPFGTNEWVEPTLENMGLDE